MQTFDLTCRKVYFTGESYAGQYIPYFAYEMLITNNTDYYNVAGIQINDPSINDDQVMITAPAVGQLNEQSLIFGLNESTMSYLNEQNVKCGYDSKIFLNAEAITITISSILTSGVAEFMSDSLTYPPTGPLPSAPELTSEECNTWAWAINAAIYINPCFNFYHVSTSMQRSLSMSETTC